ncbi:MAG: hypothetical protein RL017_555 [Pseudomonadota bacterium]|jgi:cysteine synthase|nr:cysteine synthase family protein [Burkholderiales bacterium]
MTTGITTNILDLIGNTPLLKVKPFAPTQKCNVLAKCEMFNPTLSVKDRIVYYIIKQFEKEGKLKPGYTIYEASTGNTGSSLAMIGSVLGYNVVISVPSKTSDEKINTMKSYGAEVVICREGVDAKSPEHYINAVKILKEKNPNSVLLNQYENEYNVDAHYKTTADEIWQQTNGKIDYFVAAASTGGTITGISKYLKQKNSKIKVIMADPFGSIFYNHFHKKEAVKYKSYIVEGAGKDKICPIHDFSLIDDAFQFTDDEAFGSAKNFAKQNGILIGGSAGGVICVTNKLISQYGLQDNQNVVALLADSGFKYLSRNM